MHVPLVTGLAEVVGIHPLPDLPILEKRKEILQKIKDNQVVVVLGETGCGKTTMIPLFLLDAGLGYFGKIGITEPRRIAAFSLMPYVSGFIDSDKNVVAGHTRFWNTTNKDTQIEFMTDGILTEEMLYDPELTEYSVVMIDEAHERSQNIDYILGHLKNIRKSRPELRIVIASATIDALKFSKFFDDAPIIEIPGRVYPVEVIYSDVPHFVKKDRRGLKGASLQMKATMELPSTALEVALKIAEIHKSNKNDFLENSGILAKLTGRDEIAECTEYLKFAELENVVILPAYGHMDLNEQAAVFLNYPGKRKIVLGTNILETSVTIPGMKYGVDCGLIKQMDFYANSGRSSLQVKPHSKSGDDQFAGRLGRMQGGICYRLYTEEEYEALPEFTKPEICRTNLDSIILNMRYIGIQDVEHFPFIDLPSHALFVSAYESLKKMGALDKNEVLTDHGKKMAKLPLEPVLANMLLMSEKYGCVEQIATIVSAISASHIMLRPPEEEEQEKSDKAHERFESPISDALTILNIWDEYQRHIGDPEWCLVNYMNEKALMETSDIRQQLIEMLAEFGIDASSTRKTENILKAFALGLIHNLFKVKEKPEETKEESKQNGRKDKGNRKSRGSNTYYPVLPGRVNDPVFIHPSSSTFGTKPPLLVCLEVVRTTKEYMRTCSSILPKWLSELLPKKFVEGEKFVSSYQRGSSVAYVKGIDNLEETKVSLKEARSIQNGTIARAKKEGCVEIVCKVRDSRRGGLIIVAQGRDYEISRRSSIEPIVGPKYYALLRKETTQNGERFFADVKFRIFELGDEKKDQGKKQKRKSIKRSNAKKQKQ